MGRGPHAGKPHARMIYLEELRLLVSVVNPSQREDRHREKRRGLVPGLVKDQDYGDTSLPPSGTGARSSHVSPLPWRTKVSSSTSTRRLPGYSAQRRCATSSAPTASSVLPILAMVRCGMKGHSSSQ